VANSLKNETEIYKIEKKHIPLIARLHIKELPNDFLSLLGYDFIANCYYPNLINQKGCFGYYAKNNKGFIGFVFFIRSKNYLFNIIKNNFLYFIIRIFYNLYKLNFIVYIFEIIFLIIFSKKSKYEIDYELAYIAISSLESGKGIGSSLITEGEKKMKSIGGNYCWVKTLTKTKENVSFYKKNSFIEYKKFLGRTYLFKKLI
jgi:ribosomal protein S18 acetylase RimI-like enzyme